MQWLRNLWHWLQRLWTKKPSKVTNVQWSITMTKTVTVTWELNGRESGGPLADSDARTLVEMSADAGANYVPINTIPGSATEEIIIPDLEAGDYQFRLTVLDQLDQSSDAHIELVNVPDESRPNPVTNVVVTME